MITIKDVEHVALLARLELSDEEKQMYAKQLNAILEYAQMLNELNTDDIPPTAHVLPLKNVWREDEVGEHLPPEEVLANAPETEGQFFKVPRIV
ncbi:Asp-tRNA(Asn)/Glu-tRNA(Gln) amidotransferase subunit GatC [Desulfofundulus thermosubterraneus]|uniref:Aspartyl/glutamyl-tRNA(Asn/Gln) amidotransferase subunit C n=1 Tax=Desulfofundulus thermosubterraneus DSM 16057 TaxID=1121432 RepID=A0A1M6IU07_9FIRM|nr:Asp-tRNA(Asn)/Glu-tRNA(Gln) amidotransferase subunit GatC [Desulfofundulus thermosubterraneus]SHJ37917.1 aspartyl/glutamyl-tRNA(Asn/Gln) amidotransferase subunit C [Desulfofundulus thermosubterraneus DSM 16057]